MKNQTLIDNLNRISQVDNSWQEKVIYNDENKEWLDFMAEIAIKILGTIRQNRSEGINPSSQKELAELMSISPQQVNKIVKGQENLTTETIFRIQKALKIQLIKIEPSPDISSLYQMSEIKFNSTNNGGYITFTSKIFNKMQELKSSYAMEA